MFIQFHCAVSEFHRPALKNVSMYFSWILSRSMCDDKRLAYIRNILHYAQLECHTQFDIEKPPDDCGVKYTRTCTHHNHVEHEEQRRSRQHRRRRRRRRETPQTDWLRHVHERVCVCVCGRVFSFIPRLIYSPNEMCWTCTFRRSKWNDLALTTLLLIVVFFFFHWRLSSHNSIVLMCVSRKREQNESCLFRFFVYTH